MFKLDESKVKTEERFDEGIYKYEGYRLMELVFFWLAEKLTCLAEQ